MRSIEPFVIGAQAELDGYYAQMREFSSVEVTEILMALAAFSARASEIRSVLVRNENRRAQTFRTKEIEPFLEEVDRQFKTWSRLISVRQQEWDISKGAM